MKNIEGTGFEKDYIGRKNIVKKVFYILVGICVFSLMANMVMIFLIKKEEQKVKLYQQEISPTYEYLNSITVRNFEELIRTKESFMVYIGRSDCSDCNFFEPMFREVVEQYQLYNKIVFLNVKKYRENCSEENWAEFKRKYGFTQTPAIIKFENGKISSAIEWNSGEGLSKDRFLDWLLDNKVI